MLKIAMMGKTHSSREIIVLDLVSKFSKMGMDT
jgi:hypothetical protein